MELLELKLQIIVKLIYFSRFMYRSISPRPVEERSRIIDS